MAPELPFLSFSSSSSPPPSPPLPSPLPFKEILCRTAIIRDKDGAFLAEGGDEESIEPTSQSISQQGFSWEFYSSTNHSLKNIGFSYLLLVVSDWYISHPIFGSFKQ